MMNSTPSASPPSPPSCSILIINFDATSRIDYDFGSSIDLLHLQVYSCIVDNEEAIARGLNEDNIVLIDSLGREIASDYDVENVLFFQSEGDRNIDVVCIKRYEDGLSDSMCTSTLMSTDDPKLQLSRCIKDSTIQLCSFCASQFDQGLLSLSLNVLVCSSCQGKSLLNNSSSGDGLSRGGSKITMAEQLYLTRKLYVEAALKQQQHWNEVNDISGSHERREMLRHQNRYSFTQRLASGKQTVSVYELPEQQAVAREVIDYATILKYCMEEIENSSSPVKYDITFMRALLKWFKCDFFKWCNKPECNNSECLAHSSNLVGKGGDKPNSHEISVGWASRVELYECKLCNKVTRFPRYNNPAYMLKYSRRGRCGEFANVFGLLCRSLSLDCRYVLDFTDHVWVEVYLPSYRKFVHVDPCERAIDSPLMYESGWNKSLSFVLSFSRYGVEDATPRYTRKLGSIIANRSESLGEMFVITSVAELDSSVESSYFSVRSKSGGSSSIKPDYDYNTESPSNRALFLDSLSIGIPFFKSLSDVEFPIDVLKNRKFSARREVVGLSFLAKVELKVEEQQGRISGDEAWKAMRGEGGGSGGKSIIQKKTETADLSKCNNESQVATCLQEAVNGKDRESNRSDSFHKAISHPFSSCEFIPINPGIISKNGYLDILFSNGNHMGDSKLAVSSQNGVHIDISGALKARFSKFSIIIDCSDGSLMGQGTVKDEVAVVGRGTSILTFQIENPSGNVTVSGALTNATDEVLVSEGSSETSIFTRSIDGFLGHYFSCNSQERSNIKHIAQLRLKFCSKSSIEVKRICTNPRSPRNIDNFVQTSNFESESGCNTADSISLILYRDIDESVDAFLDKVSTKVFELNDTRSAENLIESSALSSREFKSPYPSILGFHLDKAASVALLFSNLRSMTFKSTAIDSLSSSSKIVPSPPPSSAASAAASVKAILTSMGAQHEPAPGTSRTYMLSRNFDLVSATSNTSTSTSTTNSACMQQPSITSGFDKKLHESIFMSTFNQLMSNGSLTKQEAAREAILKANEMALSSVNIAPNTTTATNTIVSIATTREDKEDSDGDTRVPSFKLYTAVKDMIKYIFLGGKTHGDTRYFDTTSSISSIIRSESFGFIRKRRGFSSEPIRLKNLIVWSSSFVNSLFTQHQLLYNNPGQSHPPFISSGDINSCSQNDGPRKEVLSLGDDEAVSSVSLYSGDIVDSIAFTVVKLSSKEKSDPSSSSSNASDSSSDKVQSTSRASSASSASYRFGGSGGGLSGRCTIPTDEWRLLGFFGGSGGHVHNVGVVLHRYIAEEEEEEERKDNDPTGKEAGKSNVVSISDKESSSGGSISVDTRILDESRFKFHSRLCECWEKEANSSLLNKNTPSAFNRISHFVSKTFSQLGAKFSIGNFIDICDKIISSNGEALFVKILSTVLQYHRNISLHYQDPKYRRIKIHNNFFKTNIADFPFAIELLCFGPANFIYQEQEEPKLESEINSALKQAIFEYSKVLSEILEK